MYSIHDTIKEQFSYVAYGYQNKSLQKPVSTI